MAKYRHPEWCITRLLPIIDVRPSILSGYIPPVTLDAGEIEILALAQTMTDPLVLLDDEVAREEARRLKLQIRGTVGILVQAYREDLISYAHVGLLLEEIAARPDIWISAKLCEQVLDALTKS